MVCLWKIRSIKEKRAGWTSNHNYSSVNNNARVQFGWRSLERSYWTFSKWLWRDYWTRWWSYIPDFRGNKTDLGTYIPYGWINWGSNLSKKHSKYDSTVDKEGQTMDKWLNKGFKLYGTTYYKSLRISYYLRSFEFRIFGILFSIYYCG